MIGNRFFFSFICLFLASCRGYVLQDKVSVPGGIEVPFLPGDEEGLMTQEVIVALQRGGFSIVRAGSYELRLELVSEELRPVGYSYSYDEKGRLTKNLGTSETSLVARYKIALIDKKKEDLVAGPDLLVIKVDYDQELQEVPYDSVQYSMGQLNVGSEAHVSAKMALGRALASHVADWMRVVRFKMFNPETS